MEKKGKKEPVKKEGVSEIFDVEKEGKEKEVITHGIEEDKIVSENQIGKEKKILKNVVIVMIGFALLFAAVYFLVNYTKNFQYEGVNYYADKTQLAGMTVYSTSVPVLYKGAKTPYYFYLRNDPRTLSNVNFTGKLVIDKNMVINETADFKCGGDGIIGIVNLATLYKIIGTKVITDKNASCDSSGRYMYLNIMPGNETKIVQYGPECYNMYINNCEILKGTEKFMVETFSVVHQTVK